MTDPEVNETILVVGGQRAGKTWCLLRLLADHQRWPRAVRIVYDPNWNARLNGLIYRHDSVAGARHWIRRDPDAVHALDFARSADEAVIFARQCSPATEPGGLGGPYEDVGGGRPILLGIDEAGSVPGLRPNQSSLQEPWGDTLARRRHIGICMILCAVYPKAIHRVLYDQATEIRLFRQQGQLDMQRLSAARVPESVISALSSLEPGYHILYRPGEPPRGPMRMGG